MKLPLPSITSLEVKDAGKLRRRNRPAQLMTAVGHKREHRPVDGRVRDALARPLALTQHPTSLCGSAALPVQERLCCFPNRKEQRKMRMYLSSFKLGNRPEALQELVGGDRRAAIIMNALDNFPDQRAQWLQAQNDALIKLGFSVSELDLRAYFGKRSSRFYR